MAEVLACVPVFGLDAVAVAAEPVPDSDNTSAEHVRNVLARLREPPAPPPLDTPWRVQEAPVAGTARHGRLHRPEAGHAE